VHDQRPFIESIAQRLLNSAGHKNINAWVSLITKHIDQRVETD